ncbi:MAG TPA: peptidylprolyl isomerase [Candidatus Kapabacteria bacterium]|nr:peptidylprolyl isomerase [Candidatus Kapabacteria bacterium]
MVKTIVLSLLLTAGISRLSQAQLAPPKDGQALDAIVAVVGNHPIFKSSIDAQVEMILMQRGSANMSPDSLKAIRNQILQTEIDQKLLLAQADADSVTVSEQEVDDQLDQIIKNYVARFGSEAAVEQAFGKTIAELKASPDLRERTRENLIVERERYKVVPPVTSVSRQDVEEFYRLYKDSLPPIGEEAELATIVKLVKPHADQKEHARKTAEAILDSLQHGADFALMAKRYSQDETASAGGDLGGFYPRGTFLPAFEEAAFKLKPGEISGVVETSQGFHIIKLLERRGEDIHVAQILIKPTVNAMDEAVVRDSLLMLRDSALHGEDFAKLAEEHSDDPETRPFGGSLGKIPLDNLGPEQRGVIDSLNTGEISQPIHIAYSENRTGFQIVKLVHKIPAHKVSLDQDYHELEAAALQWKQSQDLQRWLATARRSIYVDVHDLSSYY